MYPEMENRRPSTTIDAILAFEQSRKIALPDTYKRFLLATNGGVPTASLFSVRGRPHAPNDYVQSFLGIGVSISSSELAYAFDLYIGGFPHGIVPIATQPFGNYICFDLRDSGQPIVLWDHRHFWSTGEWREQDLYYVADTFDEFLRILRPPSG